MVSPVNRVSKVSPVGASVRGVAHTAASVLRTALVLFALAAGGPATPALRAAPAILNSGFEDPNATATGPDVWFAWRQPVWLGPPADVASGIHAARVTAFHNYNQRVAGLAARTHVTFVAQARAPDPPARFSMYCSFTPASVEPYWYSRRVSIGGDYAPVAVPVAVPPSANAGAFYLFSDWSENWIDVDDAMLLTETVVNGGAEPDAAAVAAPEGWTAVGAPAWDSTGAESFSGSGALRCAVGEGWIQDLAAMDDGQTYALLFHARAESAAGTATLSLQWLDSSLNVIETQPLVVEVETDWSLQTFFLQPPVGRDLAAARIRLIAEPGSTADALWIDDVDSGWIGAFPDAFSPNDDGLWDSTELVARWPLDTGGRTPRAFIQSDDGLTTTLLSFAATADGGAGMTSALWDGTDAVGLPAPGGRYRASIFLPVDDAAAEVEFTRTLTLSRPAPYPDESAPFHQDEPFVGGIWLFLGGGWVETSYDEIFGYIQRDGFRHAIAFPPPGRYRECVRAAADHGVRLLLNFWEVNDSILGTWSNRGRTEADVRSLLEAKIAEADGLSSPVIGFYLVDEPHLPLHAEWASSFMRVLAGLPDTRPGLTTLIGANGARREWLHAIRPAVAMFDYYPIREAEADPVESLRTYARLLDQWVAEADEYGTPCWVVGQGISTAGSNEPPGPGGMSAVVWMAVAAGARGFFPFLYLPSGGLEGLRGFDYSPRPRLAALQETYRRIDALGTLLVDYRPDPSTVAPPGDGPLYLRIWSRPTDPDDRLLWAVNLDTESSRTLEIGFETPTAVAADPVLRLVGPGGAIQVPIPDGQEVARVTSHPWSAPLDPLRIALPVVADLTVPATATVADLTADPERRALAVSCSQDAFGVGGVHIVDVSRPTTPTAIGRLFTWGAEAAAFDATGGRLGACDGLRGFQLYARDSADSTAAASAVAADTAAESPAHDALASLQFPSPGWEWVNASGNAHDAVSDGDGGWWVSSSLRGIRHLVPIDPVTGIGGFQEVHRIETGGEGKRLGLAPSGGESDLLSILDEYSGIDLVSLPVDGPPQPAAFIPVFRGRSLVAWPGFLAVARQEYGVDLYDTRNPETPILAAHIPALSSVQDIALWRDRVLVVPDGRAGIRFVDVLDPARPREVARVLPWDAPPPFTTAVAAGPDWIAVAARGKAVRLLDPAPLLPLLPTRTWMLH